MFLTTSEISNYKGMVVRPNAMKRIYFMMPPTHIGVFTDEAQDRVYADEGPRATDASAAVGDDRPRSMDVPHVGDKGQQVLWLRGRPVVRPTRVVQMSNKLCFAGLRT